MSEDLLSLRILLVSDAAPERELVRRAASHCSIPVEVVELDQASEAIPTCERLQREEFDAVFVDSRMPKIGRQSVIHGAQVAKNRPLIVLVGAAEMKTRNVLTDGLSFDGTLAKPIDVGEARALLDACVRARLASRVLIVDDSATVRSVIRKVLQTCRFRFEADEAEEGGAALEKARAQQFDIVFLDDNMPGLDGFATLAEFKRSLPNTNVVLITSSNDPNLTDRALQAGARHVLFKPFYARDVDSLTSRLFGLIRSAK
jgi:CheY-like chemotaxis protein